MRWSLAVAPTYPIPEQLAAIELADRLGFYGFYVGDEVFHYDCWQLLAMAAARTHRIRLTAVTHIVLKDPVYTAQQLLTLDNISSGRAQLLYSIGNVAMLQQFGVDMASLRTIGRLREAHQIMRTFLDTSQITFSGKFHRYEGVFTTARSVQQHIPLSMGGIRGPMTFELAGEVSDGLMTGVLYSQDALRYAADHFKIGAERGGRDWTKIEFAAGLIGAVSPDSAAARRAARIIAAFYLPALPDDAAARHGIDPARLVPIREAFGRGEFLKAIEMTPNDIADAQALPVGSPEECIEQLNGVLRTGINHICISLVDPYLVKKMTGVTVEGVPDLSQQIALLHERVIPHVR